MKSSVAPEMNEGKQVPMHNPQLNEHAGRSRKRYPVRGQSGNSSRFHAREARRDAWVISFYGVSLRRGRQWNDRRRAGFSSFATRFGQARHNFSGHSTAIVLSWSEQCLGAYARPHRVQVDVFSQWPDLRCFSGKSTSYNFVIFLEDRTKIDLMQESPRMFVEEYPRVQAAPRGGSYRFSGEKLIGSCVARTPRQWLEILSKPPSK